MIGVYTISDKKNRIYVGSSSNIRGRFNTHRYHLRKNDHKNPKLQNTWNKYGKEELTLAVLEECEVDNIQEREQYWIDKLSPYYNILTEAYSVRGFKHSEEFKAKQRAYRHSDEVRKKMSASRKGVPKSPEHRAKIAEAHRNRLCR